ncbi:MAG: hypothetical protein FJ272_17680 [Planctomycetes bacterium]|nr:hypothetical protein [Planctomycetota bacterium]
MNVEELRADMKRRSSQIVCRFSKEYEAQVRRLAATYHDRMMAYFGKDLIRYPDGLTMAADWQKEMEYLWGLESKETVDDMVKEHGLVNRRPSMDLPKKLLEDNSGLGVFINPDEGKEIFPNFDLLSGALQRKGRDLTDEEASCIRGFFESPAISPRFVRRMIQEHGDESIKTTFLLGNQPPAYWLDFVLRTHKGMYYRKRYPSLSAV